MYRLIAVLAARAAAVLVAACGGASAPKPKPAPPHATRAAQVGASQAVVQACRDLAPVAASVRRLTMGAARSTVTRDSNALARIAGMQGLGEGQLKTLLGAASTDVLIAAPMRSRSLLNDAKVTVADASLICRSSGN